MNDPRGSVWRKWDLHLHTPSSVGCYKDKSVTNEEIVRKLVSEGTAVAAITDHYIIDVLKIKDLQKIGDGKITFLPGIELKSELGGHTSVHFIGIFSEDADLDDLWRHIQVKLKITKKDIGNRSIDELYSNFENSAKIISELGGLISVHAGTKSNSIEKIPNVEKFKRALKTDLIKQYIDLLEIGIPENEEDYRKIVFPKIEDRRPIIICSDNHNIKNYSVEENCWIKADPTFEGLRQVINEPEKRVCIGNIPSKIDYINRHKTKFIDAIEIRRDNTVNGLKNEKWFDCSIPLNHDLVAIIGNKGSGKSALTDTIGLLGNTRNIEFSFLNDKKFKDKNNKAKYFKAKIEWNDGNLIEKQLDESSNNVEPETVKYIPQNYLETICTEISETDFLSELESAIYSHIKDEDKLEKRSIRELIDFYSSTINESIASLKKDLNQINISIINIEKQLRSENKTSIENKLKQKKLELAALEKPKKVPEPTKLSLEKEKKQKCIVHQINRIRNISQFYEDDLKKKSDDLKKYRTSIESLKQSKEKIENFRQIYIRLENDIGKLLNDYGIEFKNTVSVRIDDSIIQKKISEFNEKIDNIFPLIDEDSLNSIPRRLSRCNKIKEELQEKLGKPSREYQEYLTSLKEWEKLKEEIKGNKNIPNTIEFFSNQISEIEEKLPNQLITEKVKRIEIVKNIYQEKKVLTDKYRELYTGVQNFISKHELIQKELNLQFSVSIKLDQHFSNSFFEYINRGVAGSFCGKEKSHSEMESLVLSADFNTEDDSLNFVEEIMARISHNYQRNMEEQNPENILRGGKDLIKIYNYIFSIDYLIPEYSLTMNGKYPEQLSPGERGHLLLIFYLLIEQDIKPIILDQPEENLDNQTIYKCLVPCIQEAKKRRQVIVVTHNPNIAVAADAEQIIYSEHNKIGDMEITYESGAIENPKINKRILDVLEGTRPAFDNRESKYLD